MFGFNEHDSFVLSIFMIMGGMLLMGMAYVFMPSKFQPPTNFFTAIRTALAIVAAAGAIIGVVGFMYAGGAL